jgi:hypothetical protein
MRSLTAEYLGAPGARQLEQRPGDCRPLADAARTIEARQLHIHTATGDAVAELLPASTPAHVREITARIVARVPHAWANVDGVIRALLVTGMVACVARHIPAAACPCLVMVVPDTGGESRRNAVDTLLADAGDDLREILPGAA